MSLTPNRKMTERRLLANRANGRKSHGLNLNGLPPERNLPMSH
jgi:hypothetical protein